MLDRRVGCQPSRGAGRRNSLVPGICYRRPPLTMEAAVSTEPPNQPATGDVAEADAMFDAAARYCLEHPDREAFLDWFAETGPGLAPRLAADIESSGGPAERFFRLFGAAIHNELPLPQQRFRAIRTPLPGRNEPCLCGSGEKFKQCCAALAESLDLSGFNGRWSENRGHRGRCTRLTSRRISMPNRTMAEPPAWKIWRSVVTRWSRRNRSSKSRAPLSTATT